MSLKVFSCCTYSTLHRDRSADEWNALQFVRAVKGRALSGYAHVPLPDGSIAYLDQQRAECAPGWFAQLAIARIRWRMNRVALVPVPNADSVLDSANPPRTFTLAQALANALPSGQATVVDILRWCTRMPTAHSGAGSRDPQELYDALRVNVPRLRVDLPFIVLIDDVVATGAHLRAAAAYLVDCRETVIAAVCVGHADNGDAPILEPFRLTTMVLPDFVPNA